MNKRQDLLDLLKTFIQLRSNEKSILETLNQSKAKQLLLGIQDYYKLKDIETNSNYCKVFTKLYIDFENFSYDQVSKDCNISVRTLDRYRQEFNKFAEKLIDLGMAAEFNRTNVGR